MPIRVKCEKCKKTLSVKDHLAGKKIKCPVCQNIVLVTGSAPPKDEPTPPIADAGDAAKPSAVATKPAKTAKPTTDKSQTNGVPSNDKPASNGTPADKKPTANGAPVAKKPADKTKENGAAAKTPAAKKQPAADKPKAPDAPPKPPEPPTVERPPENVEAEALEAFADEPEPAEEAEPKTIDFTCAYCETDLHLPLDQGGKQLQCPNPECKRIIKVPLPVIKEKKDWRKMNRRGPSAAAINMPEQLEDAWGTEEATRARKDSLEQAGAIEEPKKPPLGVFGLLRLGCFGMILFVLMIASGIGLFRLFSTKQQVNALKDAIELVDPTPTKDVPSPKPKIEKPILQAEARRAIALLWLRSAERKAPTQADRYFIGAQTAANVKISKEEHGVHEQMFLAEIAVSQIEFAGTIDQFNEKEVWEKIRGDLARTLTAIPSPEVQAMAMRDVADRLIEKDNKLDLAIGLASSLGNPGPDGKIPLARAQQIALLCKKGDALKDAPELTKLKFVHERVGYAEGHARREQYDEALKFVTFNGPPADRLEACLGVAVLATRDRKNKAEAAKFLEKARAIVKESDSGAFSPWQRLHLLRLGLRHDEDAAAYEPLVESFKNNPQFYLRAHLELLQAKCDKAPSRLTPEALSKIESLSAIEEPPEKKGTTLALAWMILARHNARMGDSRSTNRTMFEQYIKPAPPPEGVSEDTLRPMVDIGTYLGSMK